MSVTSSTFSSSLQVLPGVFQEEAQTLYAWTVLRPLWQGHQWWHTAWITYCLLIACSFFFLIRIHSTAKRCLDSWGILRVNITDLCCWTCLLSFLNPSLWHKKTDYSCPIPPVPPAPLPHQILLVGHDHRSSFLKLMELMDIFLLQVKIVMLNKWSPFLFPRECVPFPTWVCLGCSKSFLLQVWFATFENCAQHMCSTQNASYHALHCIFSQAFRASSTLIARPWGINSLLPCVTDFLDCFDFLPFVAVISELHVSDLPFPCLCHGCRISLWTVTPSR